MVNTHMKGRAFAKKLLAQRKMSQRASKLKIKRMSSPTKPTSTQTKRDTPPLRRARLVDSELVKIDFFGKLEQEGVKEWQEEIFAPRKVNKSLEEEQMTRCMIYDEYLDEILMKHGWLIDNLDGSFPLFETLTIMEDGKPVKIMDKLLLQADKNPLFTNMDVDEYIPEPNQTIVGFDEELMPIYEPPKPDVVSKEVTGEEEDDIETDCDSNSDSSIAENDCDAYFSSDDETVGET